MQNTSNDDSSLAVILGALLLIVTIVAFEGVVLKYVLGGFGVNVSFLLAVATVFLAKVLLPSRG